MQGRAEEALREPGLNRARSIANAAVLSASESADSVELQRQIQILGSERGIDSLHVIDQESGELIGSTRSAWLGRSIGEIADGDFVNALSATRSERAYEASLPGSYLLGRGFETASGPARLLLRVDARPATRAASGLAARLTLFGLAVLGVIFFLGNVLLRKHVIRPLELLRGGLGESAERTAA